MFDDWGLSRTTAHSPSVPLLGHQIICLPLSMLIVTDPPLPGVDVQFGLDEQVAIASRPLVADADVAKAQPINIAAASIFRLFIAIAPRRRQRIRANVRACTGEHLQRMMKIRFGRTLSQMCTAANSRTPGKMLITCLSVNVRPYANNAG
jgi:hypothetical protein